MIGQATCSGHDPRRLRRCTAWLMPFLVARLLLPTGFMLSLSGSGLNIILCAGLAPSSAPTAAAATRAIVTRAWITPRTRCTATRSPQVPDHPATPARYARSHLREAPSLCPACRAVDEPQRLATLLPGFNADPAWIAPAVLIDRIRGPPLA